MKFISLKDCNLTDDFLPTRLPHLPDLEVLSVNSCNFSILPVSIKEFHFLGRLDLIECNQLCEIREIPQNIKRVLAINCTSLTSESSGKLLSQKLHEPGNTYFVLPGSRIPEWFDHCCKGPSLSFWFRNKFPSIALCIVLSSPTLESYKLIINSTQRIFFHIGTHPKFTTDHIYLFDLKMRTSEDDIKEITVKQGWNLVEVSCVSPNKEEMPKWVGVYAYKKKNNMEDISFIRPDYAKRKFDDFLNYNPDSKLVGDQSLKRHPALVKKLERMTTWCYHAATPIILEAIWSMQAPPSIKILLWEICHHELPTCADLYTKKLSDSPICHICKGEPETLEHVFLLCPWTRPIWFECEFQWIVDMNSLKCIEVWLCQRLQKIKRIYPNFSQVNGLLGCICWCIWKGRNEFIFDGKPVNPMNALKRAETLYKEYSSSLSSSEAFSSIF
ncbi:hypothetical protein L6164_008487 [Bauhinia variegata]|uniref:Uncharacterized protein n=1 Tax=Bauhinia variegata TaxID=167791 RepID=A0ACB9PJP8_BAUVA|nr:hypothetical protein L6164_008487 [Bauhinia variegata]